MIDSGGPAPDFMLRGVDGGRYMLSTATNEGPVVLAFVPPSASEAREVFDTLADIAWAELIDRVAVFGICPSADVAETCSGRGYPFPILVDETGYVANLYELSTGRSRALALADESCSLVWAWTDGPSATLPRERLESAVAELAD